MEGDSRGTCEPLGLFLSTLGSDKLIVDANVQRKGLPKNITDPSFVSRTHIKVPSVMAHICTPSETTELCTSLTQQSWPVGELQTNVSVYLEWRWAQFLRTTLQVVLWSFHIHTDMHMCLHTLTHTCTHMYKNNYVPYISNWQFVTADLLLASEVYLVSPYLMNSHASRNDFASGLFRVCGQNGWLSQA